MNAAQQAAINRARSVLGQGNGFEDEEENNPLSQQSITAAQQEALDRARAVLGQTQQKEEAPSALGGGLSRGVDILQGALGSAVEGVGRTFGLESVENYGASVVERNDQQLAEQERYATRLDDVDSASSGLKYLGGIAGESAPQMGTTIAGATAGGIAGSFVPIIGTTIGAIAGGIAANLPYFYGSNRERQKEAIDRGEREELSEGAAALTAIPQSALDAIVTFIGAKYVFKPAAEVGGGIFTRAAKGAGVGAATEIPTEIGQAVLERAQAGLDITGDEAFKEYAEAGIAAGLLGGSIGGAVGVARPSNSETRLSTPQAEQLRQEDNQLSANAIAEARKEKIEAENQQQQQDALDDVVYEKRVAAAATFTPEEEFNNERATVRKTQQEEAIANVETELGQAFKTHLKQQRLAGAKPLYDTAAIKKEQTAFLKSYNDTKKDDIAAEDNAAYEQALDLHAEQVAAQVVEQNTATLEAQPIATAEVEPETEVVQEPTSVVEQQAVVEPETSQTPFSNDAKFRSALTPQRQKVYDAIIKSAENNTLGDIFSVTFESGAEAAPETNAAVSTTPAALKARRARQKKLLKNGGVTEKTLVKVFKKQTKTLNAKDQIKFKRKTSSQPLQQDQQIKILQDDGVSSELITQFKEAATVQTKPKAAKERGFKIETNNAVLKSRSGIANASSAGTQASAVITAMRKQYGEPFLREALAQAGVTEGGGVEVADAQTSTDLVSEGGMGLSTVATAGGSQAEGASADQDSSNKQTDTKRFKAAGMTDEQVQAFYNPQDDVGTAEAELAQQVLEDIENAKFAIENADKLLRAQWNANNAADGPSYDDLTLNNKIDWMETVYATLGEPNQSAVLAEKANSLRGITDATTQDNESGRTEVQEPSGETASAELPEDTGRGTEADTKPAESDGESFTAGEAKTAKVETKRKRKIVKPKFSLDEAEAAANGTTANALNDAIKWFIGKDANWRTSVVNSPNDLIGLVLSKQLNIDGMSLGEILDTSSAQGAVLTDNDGVTRAFFFAENITAGNERAVIAHELGGHIGLDNVLTREQQTAATQKIREWATSEGTSLEKAIAERALSRAAPANAKTIKRRLNVAATDELSGVIDKNAEENVRVGTDADSEVVAYFLEEAIKAGVNPTSDSKSDLVSFIRQLWSDFKRALRRLRPDNESALSPQDLVNMARGAARLELATDFHGSTQAFRKVSPDFIGLGNNAVGVGFYVSEDQETGAEYMVQRMNERKATGGALERIDTTVADTEFVDWKRPLSEQPSVLTALDSLPNNIKADLRAEMGDSEIENMTGRQMYLGLTGLQMREYTLENLVSDDAYNRASQLSRDSSVSMAITSAYLDSIGVKGIKVPIAPNTAKPDATFNKIIFNADNVVVVGRNDAADVGVTDTTPGTVRFSVPESETDNQISWARKNLGDGVGETLANLKKISKQPLDATKNLDRLVRENEQKMPSARKWFDFMLAAEATKNDVLSMVEAVINQARPFNMERKELINDFLGASTFYQKWGYDPKWTDRKTGKAVEVEIDPVMEKKYNRLSDEEKQLVRDVFTHGRTLQIMMQDIAENLGVSKFFKFDSKLKGPYAPLKRFGNYVGELKSKKLLAAETALSKDPTSDNRKALEKLKSDGDHYVISFFESEGAAETFVNANADKYEYAEFAEKAITYEESRAGGARAYEKILGAVNANLAGLDQSSKDAMAKMVRDMYFQTLDDSNARLSGTKRLNRAGYDKDMLRSFAVHGMAQANLMAQMKHGADISAALVDAYKEAKKNPRALLPVYNKIAIKFQRVMTPRTGMLASIETNVMKFNSFYMLTSSLGYFFQNMTQPYFAAANVAGEFGWKQAQTWGKLFSGYGVAKKVINTGFLNQIKNVGTMGLLGGNSTVELDLDQAAPELRPLLKELQSRGLLDVGITEDLRHVNMSPNVAVRAYDEMTHRLYQSARYVEANNRIASAVAAFKMAQLNPQKMKRLKMTPQEFAVRIVQDTQGNFSQLDAPAAFDVLPKAPLQFRKYQFQMGWLYLDAMKQAFKGADSDTKKAGFRKFSLMMSYTGVLGGLVAVPMSNVASSLLQAAIAAASGDDEENPPKSLERWIRENVEDERTATLLTRGVPAALGWDFSQKLDQSDLFMPYNSKYVELDPSRDGALLFAAQIALGPTGTVVGNIGNIADFLNRGNYYRAAEYALPKGMRAYLETMRFADTGYTTRSELKITDPTKFDAVDFLTNAIGLPSTDINQIKWKRGQQIEIEQWFTSESSRIKRGYLSAYDDRDRSAMAEYREEFRELQKAKDRVRPFFNNSRNVLKRASVSELIRAPRARAREQRRLDSVTGN